MFDFIHSFPFNPVSFNESRVPNSYIRVLHASPGTHALDIYANSKLIAKNISYKSFTEYITIVPGNYKIEVFPTGLKHNPLYVTNISIPSGTIHTIPIIGRIPTLSILFVAEPVMTIPAGKLFIRFAHLSPTTTNINVLQSNGSILFKNVAYKQVTNYISVVPGTYALSIRLVGASNNLLYVPNIRLLPTRFLTFYFVGLRNDTPPLQMLIPLDGNSYIKL